MVTIQGGQRTSSIGLAIVLGYASTAVAQAQVVQLPSMQNFSVQTSVLVPDSGSAYLGGVGRASQSRSAGGWSPLGGARTRSGAVMGSGVMVHATIIDHAELDAMVLEEAKAIRAAKGIELPDTTTPRVKAPRKTGGLESVAAIKRAHAEHDVRREAEAEADYRLALEYHKAGEYSLARNYYRVAAKKSTGSIAHKAAERLAELPQPRKSR